MSAVKAPLSTFLSKQGELETKLPLFSCSKVYAKSCEKCTYDVFGKCYIGPHVNWSVFYQISWQHEHHFSSRVKGLLVCFG